MRQDAAKRKFLPAIAPKRPPGASRAKANKPTENSEETSWNDLCFLLQIDLLLGREKAFVRRLKRACALAQAETA